VNDDVITFDPTDQARDRATFAVDTEAIAQP
jgi:hypothetical protein